MDKNYATVVRHQEGALASQARKNNSFQRLKDTRQAALPQSATLTWTLSEERALRRAQPEAAPSTHLRVQLFPYHLDRERLKNRQSMSRGGEEGIVKHYSRKELSCTK